MLELAQALITAPLCLVEGLSDGDTLKARCSEAVARE